MLDDQETDGLEKSLADSKNHSEFLGLSRNLWRLAIVLGVAQFSVGLWKWEFSIFLRTFTDPWMMGLTFSLATFAGLIGGFLAGYIADFIGRKKTLMLGFIPISAGLLAMSYFPLWPIILVQTGFIWYGMSSFRLMGQAIPADVIAEDKGRSPARRFMMVLMPLWLADGISPLIGALMVNFGYASSDLHRLAAFFAIAAFVVAYLLIQESLDSEIVKKARTGPIFSFRHLGPNFWKLVVGMLAYMFFFTIAIPYLGNLCVEEWGIDIVTYGYTWSAFSLASAALIYFVSGYADKNLKGALLFAVIGNGISFLAFGVASGVLMLFIINIGWAVPFIVWLGVERSILVANVPEEAKGRALGTYGFLMGTVSMVSQNVGAFIWTISGSLRFLWTLAGVGMIASTLILAIVLRKIDLSNDLSDPPTE